MSAAAVRRLTGDPAAIYLLDVFVRQVQRSRCCARTSGCCPATIILPVLAEIVQILNYGIGLLNTGVTIALLIIFISVQTDRELRLERQEKALAEARIDTMLSQIQPAFSLQCADHNPPALRPGS